MKSVDKIVIESLAQDAHAFALGWALRQRDADCSFVLADNFPSKSSIDVAISPGAGTLIHYAGPEGAFEIGEGQRFVYWARRLGGPYNVAPLAADDVAASERENRVALTAFRELLAGHPGAIFINDLACRARADRKPVQLDAANKLGFMVPRTLFSNDPARIVAFIEAEGGRVIYKTSTPMSWRQHTGQGLLRIMTYSHLVGADDIAGNPTIAACSGIYQQPIPKAYEARVTVMGETCFATRINSQENPRTTTDWRVDQANLHMEPMDLPEAVATRCMAFLRSLGLLFGCFDFVVTPEGDWYFLECNEQGQWLWQESHCPDLTMLDAFAEFIRAPSPSFRYQPDAAPLRLRDYMAHHWETDLRQSIARNVIRTAPHVRVEGNAAPAARVLVPSDQ